MHVVVIGILSTCSEMVLPSIENPIEGFAVTQSSIGTTKITDY